VAATAEGPVVGSREQAVDPRQNLTVSWTAYYDLPYAAPPLGDLRFRTPQPPSPWSCLRDATRTEGAVCPQPNINITLGGLVNGGLHESSSEDCLLLNVYVPDSESADLLPVIFWTHGGGYNAGAGRRSDFGPLYYLSHGVVVVAVRYRLGTLGFLSLGTEDVPGNMGVRDQVAALQWTQQNIAGLGGDPALVTVMGQSAGAMSTTFHLYSPLAQGLFRRVILQSGTGGFAPSYKHFSEERAIRFGKLAAIEVGCLSLSLEAIAACLREKPVINLLATELLNELMAQPSIDGGHMEEPYLPVEPELAITSGQYFSGVDVLLGSLSDETLIGTQFFLAAPDLFGVFRELWDALGPYALLQRHTSEQTAADRSLAASILRYYIGEVGDLGPATIENFANFTNMFDDSFMLFATHRFLDLHIPVGTGKTFLYRNSYYGQYHNEWAPGLDHFPGVAHSDDLFLQWSPLDSEQLPLNSQDAAMSLQLTKY
jgi:carboxylesterase type B